MLTSLRSTIAAFRDDLAAGVRDEWVWIRARAAALPWRPGLAGATGLLLATALVPASDGAAANVAPPTLAATTAAAGMPGSTEPGREGSEDSARALAASVGVPLAGADWRSHLGTLTATDPALCPASRLRVAWERPGPGYTIGGHVEPIGPAPTDATRRVNGVVVCDGSTYAYLGFEAAYELGRWWVTPVPSLAHESDDPTLLPGEAEQAGAAPASAIVGESPAEGLPSIGLWDGVSIEPLAIHEPQVQCDPVAKAGVLGFRDLLLAAFPSTRNLGIGRACEVPGVSEHKEGRAFDWGVRAHDEAERVAAETVINWLLATDALGNEYAIARRTGLMYVIWNGHIWSAERAHEGWRPYVGVSDHTDHVHFSFSWPGALARTSFWAGELRNKLRDNAPDLPLLVPRLPAVQAPVLPGLLFPGGDMPPDDQQQQQSTAGDQAPPPETTTTSTASPPPSSTTTSTTTTTTTAVPITSPTVLPPIGSGGTGFGALGGS